MIIMTMTYPQLRSILLWAGCLFLALTTGVNANEESNIDEQITVTFRNDLPLPIELYYHGSDEDRHPQGVIEGKGGEVRLNTYPDHRFSYDYNNERHYVTVTQEDHLSLENPDHHPVRVLLAGRVEVKVQCIVTTNSQRDEGILNLRIIPWWSPHGASHFLSLVRKGYYDGVALHRVVPNFLTQFGISPNKELREEFQFKNIRDDAAIPRPHYHETIAFKPGYLSYAGSGKDSRTTEVFIVMPGTEQSQLNWFGRNVWETPFGLVDELEVSPVAGWKSYGDIPPFGEGPDSQKIYQEGGYEYLESQFPQLDYIRKCVVVEIGSEDDAFQQEL